MVVGPITPDAGNGRLTINGVDLHTYAWCVQDIRPLTIPGAYRGENEVVGGAEGELELPYRIGAATHDLEVQLTGVCDSDGMPYTTRQQGLDANLAELESDLLMPPTPPETAFDASITERPAGPDLFARVQVLGLELGENELVIYRAVLRIRIPGGYFKAEAS